MRTWSASSCAVHCNCRRRLGCASRSTIAASPGLPLTTAVGWLCVESAMRTTCLWKWFLELDNDALYIPFHRPCSNNGLYIHFLKNWKALWSEIQSFWSTCSFHVNSHVCRDGANRLSGSIHCVACAAYVREFSEEIDSTVLSPFPIVPHVFLAV